MNLFLDLVYWCTVCESKFSKRALLPCYYTVNEQNEACIHSLLTISTKILALLSRICTDLPLLLHRDVLGKIFLET